MRAAPVWAKIFAALLRLYPSGFRAEFGDEMQQVFRSALAEAGGQGHGAVSGTLAREFSGLLFDIGRQHVMLWKGALGMMAQAQTPSGHVLQLWSVRISLSIIFLLISSLLLLVDHFTAALSYLPHTLIYCGAWTLILWWLWPAPSAHPGRTRLAVLAAVVVIVFGARAATWNSRKAILIDVRQARPGTHIDEVDRLMSDYMRSPAAPGTLSDHINIVADNFADLALRATRPGEGTVVYRHTTEGWGNSDWVIINFEDFRVVRVTFSPD